MILIDYVINMRNSSSSRFRSATEFVPSAAESTRQGQRFSGNNQQQNGNSSRNIPCSYSDEWNALLLRLCNFEVFQRFAATGKLQGTRFRSVYWRLLLGALPAEVELWRDAVAKNRQAFVKIKAELSFDPRDDEAEANDLLVNNPLSLNEEIESVISRSSALMLPNYFQSPWMQYFHDKELLAYIQQDVDRTFPELEYFHSTDVRDLMRSILFLYARKHPHVSYKQGMHEVLAPLIFVLFFDQQSYAHACEINEVSPSSGLQRGDLLELITEPAALEADAFELFSRVMAIIQPWYFVLSDSMSKSSSSSSLSPPSRPLRAVSPLLSQTPPFARPQDNGPGTAIVRKLNYIGDHLLKEFDLQLYVHLERMEIAPQIYGIRWLRLLYGREFPIQDLLVCWDAIFADGPPFALVDYIFVAMLIAIRDFLLASDYSGCLYYLMKYPAVADIQSLLELAFHFQDPVKYTKPAYFGRAFGHLTSTGEPHPGKEFRLFTRKPTATFSAYVNSSASSSSQPGLVSNVSSTASVVLPASTQSSQDSPQPDQFSVSPSSVGGASFAASVIVPSSRSFFPVAIAKKLGAASGPRITDGSAPPAAADDAKKRAAQVRSLSINSAPGAPTTAEYGGVDFLQHKRGPAQTPKAKAAAAPTKLSLASSSSSSVTATADNGVEGSSSSSLLSLPVGSHSQQATYISGNSPRPQLSKSNNYALELMKEQIGSLQTRLNDVESTSHYVADKLLVCSDFLCTRLRELEIDSSDSAYETVSELKHMCYQLRGLIHPCSEQVPIITGAINSPVEIGTDISKQEQSNAELAAQRLSSSTSSSSILDFIGVSSSSRSGPCIIGPLNELKELKVSNRRVSQDNS